MATQAGIPTGIPLVIPTDFTDIDPPAIDLRQDLFSALHLRALYKTYAEPFPIGQDTAVKGEQQQQQQQRNNRDDIVASPRDADAMASPGVDGAASGPSFSAGGAAAAKAQGAARTRRRRFGRFYDSIIEDVMDPTPVSPRPTLTNSMDPPPQLDDPNYRFSSLLGTDRVRMGLRLEAGHAQGVKGRYKGGVKEGVMTANQRRKARKREQMAQRGTAPARMGGGDAALAGGATPGWSPTTPFPTSMSAMTPGYFAGASAPGASTPGYFGGGGGASASVVATPSYFAAGPPAATGVGSPAAAGSLSRRGSEMM